MIRPGTPSSDLQSGAKQSLIVAGGNCQIGDLSTHFECTHALQPVIQTFPIPNSQTSLQPGWRTRRARKGGGGEGGGAGGVGGMGWGGVDRCATLAAWQEGVALSGPS